jgi:hypothetical protein
MYMDVGAVADAVAPRLRARRPGADGGAGGRLTRRKSRSKRDMDKEEGDKQEQEEE